MTRPFSPELRTASVVPRWSVVWTLTRDTVANHSYYVAMYAQEIAGLIYWRRASGPAGPADTYNYEALHFLTQFALIHDLDETITGDIVSPVKREILNQGRADKYIKDKMALRLPRILELQERINRSVYAYDILLIVKAADRLDALLFLICEKRMGNAVIVDRIPQAWENLKEAWFKLPHRPGYRSSLETLWTDTVVPAINAHSNSGGDGV